MIEEVEEGPDADTGQGGLLFRLEAGEGVSERGGGRHGGSIQNGVSCQGCYTFLMKKFLWLGLIAIVVVGAGSWWLVSSSKITTTIDVNAPAPQQTSTDETETKPQDPPEGKEKVFSIDGTRVGGGLTNFYLFTDTSIDNIDDKEVGAWVHISVMRNARGISLPHDIPQELALEIMEKAMKEHPELDGSDFYGGIDGNYVLNPKTYIGTSDADGSTITPLFFLGDGQPVYRTVVNTCCDGGEDQNRYVIVDFMRGVHASVTFYENREEISSTTEELIEEVIKTGKFY